MNRLAGGRTYIVDSAGLWLTNDSSATGSFLDLSLQSVNFVSTGSGDLELTVESNTAGAPVIRLTNSVAFGSTRITFPLGLKVDERIFVKTCATGTAWLYFA